MRPVLTHPLAITLLSASALLAAAARLLPELAGLSVPAAWILFWGVFAYTVTVTALAWPPADTMAALPDDLGAGRSIEASLAGEAIARRLRGEAIQQPATLLCLASALTAASYRLLLAPTLGGGTWAGVILVASVAAAGGSFLWSYVFRYSERYVTRVEELTSILDRRQQRLERTEEKELRERLKEGFAFVESAAGIRSMRTLDEEFWQLQPILATRRQTDPLALAQVPALARETYRRGLSILDDALGLMRAADGPDRARLEFEIGEYEREIASLAGDESRRVRVELREQLLSSHRQRLESIDQLQLKIDQLLYQADRCEASLHRSRIELAEIHAGSSEVSVDTVIETLRKTVEQARATQVELRQLSR